MILYLASTQHTNLLDFTGLYEDDTVTIKKMVGNFVLAQFIVYDMRNFSHCSELILDRPAFGDSDTEFTQAIEEFLTMYSARITVIYEGLEPTNPLFSALLSIGVGNIVTGVEIDEMQTEIRECLSENGMTWYNPKERAKPKSSKESYAFDCENIRVAVLSSQDRMGATTAAMGLATWLHNVGATSCYVEANHSGHLTALARAYEMKQTENGFILDSMDYLTDEPQDPRQFIVYDMGKDCTQHIQALQEADLLLLCCGLKPYEMQYTMKLLRQFETKYAYILCPFVEDSLKESYADALQSDYHKLLFTDYQPDPMNPTPNRKHYKGIIQKYIAGASANPQF